MRKRGVILVSLQTDRSRIDYEWSFLQFENSRNMRMPMEDQGRRRLSCSISYFGRSSLSDARCLHRFCEV